MLEDGTREWRGELGEVSEEAIVWQPVPNGHSIGGILIHIARAEMRWFHEVVRGISPTPEDRDLLMWESLRPHLGEWPAPPRRPLCWYLDVHDRIRARSLDLLAGLTDPAEEFAWRDDRVTLRWVLHHVICHEAYHGGQAVLLALQHGSW